MKTVFIEASNCTFMVEDENSKEDALRKLTFALQDLGIVFTYEQIKGVEVVQ